MRYRQWRTGFLRLLPFHVRVQVWLAPECALWEGGGDQSFT